MRPPAPLTSPGHRVPSSTSGVRVAVRFAVETAMYTSLAYSGASIAGPVPLRAAFGALAPLGALVVWSQYLGPRARRRHCGRTALAAEAALCGAAIIGLGAPGHVTLAATLGAVALVNASLVHRAKRASDPVPALAR